MKQQILEIIQSKHVYERLTNRFIIAQLFPPLLACIDVDQPNHGETVFEHCLKACTAIPHTKPMLRIAALFHDCGKPITMQEKENSCTFYNHDIIGARIVFKWAITKGFSISECQYLSIMVRYHMFRFPFDVKLNTIRRWLKKINGLYKDLIMLRMADRKANKAKEGKPLMTLAMKDLLFKIHEIQYYKEPLKVRDLAVSGHDIMLLGVEEGPAIGAILTKLLEDVKEQPDLNTKEMLLEKAKTIIIK